MKRRAGISFGAALLALGLWTLAAQSAVDEDEKKAIAEAQKDILKLASAMESKAGDVQSQVKAIHKKNEDLKTVMYVYKPRKKGGLGMGKDGDGIENELNRLSGPKSRLTPARAKELKKDLIQAAYVSKAIADVTDLYPPKKDVQKWKGYTSEMRKGADELIDAAKSDDGAKIKRALTNLNSSCTNCHSDFRND